MTIPGFGPLATYRMRWFLGVITSVTADVDARMVYHVF